MGGGAYHLALARPLAVDGVPLRTRPATASSNARSILTFALAEVLVDGGERVGVPGLMRPSGSRVVIERMAEAIIHDPRERPSLPQGFAPAALSEIVLLSDFWSPTEEMRKAIAHLSASGAPGHLVQVVDPAEEVFPYSGRVEFVEPETGESITAGRAETWRADYEARIARHRADIKSDTDRLHWSFTIHHTDRPAADILLALHARMGVGASGACDRRPPCRDGTAEAGMIPGLPLVFSEPLVLLGLLSLPVLWLLLRLIPPRPRRIAFPPTRLLFDIKPKEETPAQTPWWLVLLRLMLAALLIIAAAGPLWNPGLATATSKVPLAPDDRRRLGGGCKLECAAAHRRRSARRAPIPTIVRWR